jgi:benzil reductase ((S)-benzoin forming)
MNLYLVTGSSRGIGESLACELVSPEAIVIGLARHRSERLSQFESAGARVLQLAADLSVPDFGVAAVLAQLDATLASLGKTRLQRAVLINNAGMVDPIGQSEHLESAAVARACMLNLAAPISLSAAFVTRLRDHADSLQVLNISSGAGRRPFPGWSVYCATKAGLDLYSQTLSAEEATHASRGARVVSLAPGVVDTAMQGRIREHGSEHFPAIANFIALKQQGALAAPEAVAKKIAAFLVSPQFGSQVIADLRELD